jgi:hypothetical protein
MKRLEKAAHYKQLTIASAVTDDALSPISFHADAHTPCYVTRIFKTNHAPERRNSVAKAKTRRYPRAVVAC